MGNNPHDIKFNHLDKVIKSLDNEVDKVLSLSYNPDDYSKWIYTPPTTFPPINIGGNGTYKTFGNGGIIGEINKSSTQLDQEAIDRVKELMAEAEKLQRYDKCPGGLDTNDKARLNYLKRILEIKDES